jgi:hypothetical protein
VRSAYQPELELAGSLAFARACQAGHAGGAKTRPKRTLLPQPALHPANTRLLFAHAPMALMTSRRQSGL